MTNRSKQRAQRKGKYSLKGKTVASIYQIQGMLAKPIPNQYDTFQQSRIRKSEQ